MVDWGIVQAILQGTGDNRGMWPWWVEIGNLKRKMMIHHKFQFEITTENKDKTTVLWVEAGNSIW